MAKNTSTKNSNEPRWLKRSRPLHRFVLGLLTAIAAFILMPGDLPLIFKLVVSWLGFCIAYLIISWLIIARMNVAFIKAKANEEDGSAAYVFTLILLASFASLFAVLLLAIDKDDIAAGLLVPVSMTSMLLSWFMVHTLFIFHYAHQYYDKGNKNQGLNFPGDKDEDYMDFAYFSFVIGCTFQVSDVEITSKEIRRTVFFHGLLSFLLNTFVVALTINIIAGLLN